jgi:hypothetical protein
LGPEFKPQYYKQNKTKQNKKQTKQQQMLHELETDI